MDTATILWSSVFAVLPLLDLCRVYMTNLCTKRNHERRMAFAASRDELVHAWCMVGFKVGNIVVLIFGTLLLMVLLFRYHWDKSPEDSVVLMYINIALLGVWFQYIFVLLYDSISYGQTTINTRITFVVCLICQTMLCVTAYQDTDNVCRILAYVQTLMLLFSLLLIVTFPKDYVIKNVILAEYKFQQSTREYYIKPQTEVTSDNLLNRSKDKANVQSDSIVSFSKSHAEYFRPTDDNLIRDIHIITFKESQKYQKRTIIYQIDYKLNNQPKKVFRSFREFLSFHSDLRYDQPNQVLPLFPSKRSSNKYLSMDDIQQRQEMLDTFLKGILIRFNTHAFFRQFLNCSNDTLQYKQKFVLPQSNRKMYQLIFTESSRIKSVSRTQSIHKNQTHASIPETIWEGLGEEDEESIKDDRKKKRIARSQDRLKSLFHSNPQNCDITQDLLSKTYDDYDFGQNSPMKTTQAHEDSAGQSPH